MLFRDRSKTSNEMVPSQKRLKSSRPYEPLPGSRDTGVHETDLQFQIGELRRVIAQLKDESRGGAIRPAGGAYKVAGAPTK